MICSKCDHDLQDCDCPNALERIEWILSPDSPVYPAGDYRGRLIRRMQELQGQKELKELGQ